MGTSKIELRPATPSDFEFLWQLQCEAMRPSVEQQFGPWDEAFQRSMFESSTDPGLHDIVELDGRPIGCQWVRAEASLLELERLHLLPEVQGQGIGTELLERLIARAKASGLLFRLQAFRMSPARSLYARLGFETVARSDTHETMELLP